jgi:hypothetical protein
MALLPLQQGRLMCRAKPNVPFVRLEKMFLKNAGCCVSEKSAVRLLWRTKVWLIVYQLNGCLVGLYACCQRFACKRSLTRCYKEIISLEVCLFFHLTMDKLVFVFLGNHIFCLQNFLVVLNSNNKQ